MPVDQPPAIIEQVKPAVTPQQQWSTLTSLLIHEEALASQYRADVMNFTGAAANAKTNAEQADIRVAALREALTFLNNSFRQRGFKFVDDEWVSP
jgi:hypothetical protein